MAECKHENLLAYTEDGQRYYACRDCGAVWPILPPDTLTGKMGGETVRPMDPWKAVHRIKLNHEAVVNAAQVVVNCAEWQGRDGPDFLAEAVRELKAALAKLHYTQPPQVSHD